MGRGVTTRSHYRTATNKVTTLASQALLTLILSLNNLRYLHQTAILILLRHISSIIIGWYYKILRISLSVESLMVLLVLLLLLRLLLLLELLVLVRASVHLKTFEWSHVLMLGNSLIISMRVCTIIFLAIFTSIMQNRTRPSITQLFLKIDIIRIILNMKWVINIFDALIVLIGKYWGSIRWLC